MPHCWKSHDATHFRNIWRGICWCPTKENIPIPVTLTHISLASFVRDIGKQCRPRSDNADQDLYHLLTSNSIKIWRKEQKIQANTPEQWWQNITPLLIVDLSEHLKHANSSTHMHGWKIKISKSWTLEMQILKLAGCLQKWIISSLNDCV